jgi:hypothetical protein
MKLVFALILTCITLICLAQNESVLVIQKVIGTTVKSDTLRGAKADSARALKILSLAANPWEEAAKLIIISKANELAKRKPSYT